METKKNIEINGEKYVLEASITSEKKSSVEEEAYVMCRTYSAGVFAGYLKSRKGKEATLLKARRIYYWDGAASLSELAMRGTSKPINCKFPMEVDEVVLTEVTEILPITKQAQESIASVKVWSR